MCCVSRVFPSCRSLSVSPFLSCFPFSRWRSHQMALLRQVDRFHFASITGATGESSCFKGPWLCNQPFAGMLWVISEQLYAEKCVRPSLGLFHEGSFGCHSILNYLQLSSLSLNIDIWPLLPWQTTLQLTDQTWCYFLLNRLSAFTSPASCVFAYLIFMNIY